ncbi:MAG: Ferredoxin-2 [Chloroflexi bacterium ADurb.Bin325]|nr:MAG: Ferredoxin-2 [Chloroflexi bacterium ADurb.Bin325]
MKLPLWPRPSTRAFMREARRTPGYGLFDWLHGYIYARWPYLYIGIGTGEHPLAKRGRPIVARLDALIRRLAARHAEPEPAAAGAGQRVAVGFADTYHGKVVTLETATRLVQVERSIDLGDLEQVIPYALARDIVLQHPDHIVALECPCRSARAEPCLPLDVCLIVGEPFASFITEHQPRRSRWITSDEAVAILQAEHERGHVHHAFFKDAMLGRFYAICNCCSCCCGAIQAHRNGVPMLAASGYVSQVDEALCAGCGQCVDVCQFDALALDGGRSIVDLEKCMGCGVCVDHCPQGALALVRDESKGLPLDMQALLSAASSAGPDA